MSDKVPATKPAGDLEPGDYVIAEDLMRSAEGIAEVLLAKKFGLPGRQDVSVHVSFDDRYEPESCRLPIDKPIRLASAEQVAEREAEGRRQDVASVLRQLALLIVDKRLPLPGLYQGFGVTMNFGRDVALVERIGAELGLKVSDSYGTTSVEWPAGQEPGGLTATWSAYSPKKAEAVPKPDPDLTGLLHSRADADNDPTPVGAREPLHTGAMTDGGLVDETPAEPVLVHMGFVAGGTVCGLPVEGNTRRRESLVWSAVTCQACIDAGATSPEAGERVEVGADGCGCPITEEIRPNDTSIDGTERVEHRSGCWALRLAADTVPVSAEDATLTQLPDPDSAGRAAALQRAKETFA